MSGYVSDLSPRQVSVLQQFKEAVADIPNKPDDTDHFYLRWLRAKKFNLQKAETMFRKHIEYRKKYGADTILHDYTPPELFTECLPGGFFGEDLDGHPVTYDNLGNMDIKGMYRSTSLDEILKFKCYKYEKLDMICKQQSEKKGKHIETVTAVVDFENLSFQKCYCWSAIEMFLKVLSVQEANYPERNKTILLINTPRIFPCCYNIVKPVIDPKTRGKIVILGSNCNLKEEMQKYISLDELPAMYGGNQYAPDAECSDFIRPGRDVPPKYYLTNQMGASKEHMTRVVIGSGLVHEVCCEVVEAGSTLQWEFFSTDYDISFGICMGPRDETEKVTILESSRTKSHLFPQTGHHHCLIPGQYVFKFDNSFSWTRSKEVFYTIKEVLTPNAQASKFPVANIGHISDMPTTSHLEEDKDENTDCCCSNGQETSILLDWTTGLDYWTGLTYNYHF